MIFSIVGHRPTTANVILKSIIHCLSFEYDIFHVGQATNNGEYDTEINYSLPRFQLLAQATIIVGRISLVTYNLLLSLQD